MDINKLREFVKFMEENNLSELEIEDKDIKVKLKKNIGSSVNNSNLSLTPPSSPSTHSEKETKKHASNLVEIKAPMVGTFYRAPAPDAAPFVEVGDSIKNGDTLCIIEAMKLMNEIKSDVKGKIKEILVENAEPVEYGQVLFLVEPA